MSWIVAGEAAALARARKTVIEVDGYEVLVLSHEGNLYAFQKTVHRYEIPKQYFLDLAEGCRMDLTIKRYPTWSKLETYCYHVAGVVGLIMCAVLRGRLRTGSVSDCCGMRARECCTRQGWSWARHCWRGMGIR